MAGGAETDELHQVPLDAEAGVGGGAAFHGRHPGAVDLFHFAALAADEVVVAAGMVFQPARKVPAGEGDPVDQAGVLERFQRAVDADRVNVLSLSGEEVVQGVGGKGALRAAERLQDETAAPRDPEAMLPQAVEGEFRVVLWRQPVSPDGSVTGGCYHGPPPPVKPLLAYARAGFWVLGWLEVEGIATLRSRSARNDSTGRGMLTRGTADP